MVSRLAGEITRGRRVVDPLPACISTVGAAKSRGSGPAQARKRFNNHSPAATGSCHRRDDRYQQPDGGAGGEAIRLKRYWQ